MVLEHTRADKSRQEQTRADKSRQEQTRADKNRREQIRADKSRQEQTVTSGQGHCTDDDALEMGQLKLGKGTLHLIMVVMLESVRQ
jgi:hypothetical protein